MHPFSPPDELQKFLAAVQINRHSQPSEQLMWTLGHGHPRMRTAQL
jgi:hypothetical protein